MSNGFREKLNEAAFNIVNLECPLTRENEPAAKWGSSLKALPESIEALRKIPGLVVNLANNHIRDYGSQGVLDTIQVLEEYDIPYLGAGRELEHSNRSLILESSSYKIGVYSCTEHEFSIAGEKSAGAHPVEEGEDILALQKLKRQTDYVIFFIMAVLNLSISDTGNAEAAAQICECWSRFSCLSAQSLHWMHRNLSEWHIGLWTGKFPVWRETGGRSQYSGSGCLEKRYGVVC